MYGHHSVDEPTQFVNLRVEGIGTVPRGAWRERIAPRHDHDRQPSGVRQGRGLARHRRARPQPAEAGESYPGPLVVEQLDTTMWIPPGDVARVDEHGNIVVEVDTRELPRVRRAGAVDGADHS